jgi:hypothetical protein
MNFPGKAVIQMKIRFELKIALGILFALMLGGATLADSVSTYRANTASDARAVDFAVPAGPAGDRGLNPCNCAQDSGFVRKDLEKGPGWSFTAGSYSVAIPAAEPATGLFVGLGLAVFGLMRRRKRKPLENAVWENLG